MGGITEEINEEEPIKLFRRKEDVTFTRRMVVNWRKVMGPAGEQYFQVEDGWRLLDRRLSQ